jgi:hypothetical protein
MKKLDKSIIRSVRKLPKMSEYVFTKDDTIPNNFLKLFLDLGVDEENFYLKHFLVTEDWDRDQSGTRFMLIDHYHDYRYNILDKNLDIDVFIGREKVILVIRTKKDRQLEISKKLFKIAKMLGDMQ